MFVLKFAFCSFFIAELRLYHAARHKDHFNENSIFSSAVGGLDVHSKDEKSRHNSVPSSHGSHYSSPFQNTKRHRESASTSSEEDHVETRPPSIKIPHKEMKLGHKLSGTVTHSPLKETIVSPLPSIVKQPPSKQATRGQTPPVEIKTQPKELTPKTLPGTSQSPYKEIQRPVVPPVEKATHANTLTELPPFSGTSTSPVETNSEGKSFGFGGLPQMKPVSLKPVSIVKNQPPKPSDGFQNNKVKTSKTESDSPPTKFGTPDNTPIASESGSLNQFESSLMKKPEKPFHTTSPVSASLPGENSASSVGEKYDPRSDSGIVAGVDLNGGNKTKVSQKSNQANSRNEAKDWKAAMHSTMAKAHSVPPQEKGHVVNVQEGAKVHHGLDNGGFMQYEKKVDKNGNDNSNWDVKV